MPDPPPALTWKPGPPPLDRPGEYIVAVKDGRRLYLEFRDGMYRGVAEYKSHFVPFSPESARLCTGHLGPLPDPPAVSPRTSECRAASEGAGAVG